VLGQPTRQPAEAADRPGLLARLADAADQDVIALSAPPGRSPRGALPFAIGERTASTITAVRTEAAIG
jgi:hypothetical protein